MHEAQTFLIAESGRKQILYMVSNAVHDTYTALINCYILKSHFSIIVIKITEMWQLENDTTVK